MEWLTTGLLVVLGLILLYKYLVSGPPPSGIPGPSAYPLVGSALQLNLGRIHEQLSDLAHQYGSIYEMKIFGTTNVLLNTAELVTKAFSGDGYKQVFNNRSEIFIADYVYERKSISTRNPGKLHGDLRKTLVKGLHVYGDGIPKFESVMKDELHRVMKEIGNSDEQGFEVVDLAKRSLSNVMTILLTGEPATEVDMATYFEFLSHQDYLADPVNDMLLRNLPVLRHIPLYKKPISKVMSARERILDKMLYQMKETRIPGNIRGLVDWYLEEQGRELNEGKKPLLSDDVIGANILDTFAAGVMTTASVLPSALLCLINHPEYQTKIQEEIDRVIGPDREPSVRDRHDCDFLQAVVMETLRHLPPVPLLLPHRCSQDVVFEGYHVRGQTQVIANVWHIHHDERVWGDPWAFRPERFLDENGKLLNNTHPNMKSFLTFGTGRRKCAGVSLATTRIFLYLSHLLQRWSFAPVEGKCGSCDPRSGSYESELLFKPKPFYCVANRRY